MIRPDLVGKTWTFSDLKKELGDLDTQYITDHVLKPNRRELDIRNGGPVQWSGGRGSKWRFKATEMAEWIEKNWQKIMNGGWR